MTHLDPDLLLEDADPTPHEYGPLPDTMSLPRAALARIPELEGLRARLAGELFGVTVAPPRIGRFRLERKLGEGGMGQVFAAHDDALDRRVAVKVLHAERAGTPGGRARMLREAQALARLSHPNVVQVFEVGEHDGQIYVAMEHVRGLDLAHWLAAEPRSWRAVLAIYIAAGHGLQAAHAAGLVHRDFKPANVIVGDDGRVRVLDFGLARGVVGGALDSDEPRGRASDSLNSPLSMTGALHGTPVYLAPEVLQGAPADARADQYAFCVALYEGLYGARPYHASSLGGMIRAKLDGAVVRPPADSRVPGWLHAALLRGLAVDPAQRWPSLRELLAELARDRVSAWRRRWAAAAGGVLLAAAGVAGVRSLQADAAAAQAQAAAQVEQARAEAAEQKAAASAREHALVLAVRAAEAQIRRALDLAGTPARAGEAATLAASALRDALATGAPTSGPLRALVTALAAPRLLHEVRAPGRLRAASFAADEQVIATHDMDWTLRLWDVASGAQLAELAKIDAMLVAPDGGLVTLGVDGLARRDPRTGAATRVYGPGRDTLELSPDGRLAAVLHEGAIDVYDLDRAVKLVRLPGAADKVAFSADGRRVVTARGGTAHLWSLPDGRALGRLPTSIDGAFNFTNVAISPDGGRVVVTTNDYDMYFWDTRARPRLIERAAGHTHAAFVLRFSPDGRTLLSAGGDGQVFLWNAEDARVLLRLQAEAAMWIMAAAQSPDGLQIAVADGQGVLRVWDTRTAQLLARFSGERGEFNDLEFSADGQRILTAAASGAASVWSFPRGLPELAAVAARPTDADLHGDRVALLGPDGAVGLHDLGPAPRSLRLAVEDAARKSVDLAPDGATLATFSGEGVVALWDAHTGRARCSIAARLRGAPDHVIFSAADRLVGIVEADERVHAWSTADCRDLATLSPAAPHGSILAASPDALLLSSPEVIMAVPGPDGLKGTHKLAAAHTLIDPRGLVAPRSVDIGAHDAFRAGFSPDGAQLTITGREGLARVHDARTGAALGELVGLTGWVAQVVYSPDSATLLTLGGGHAAHLWRASDRALLARLELGDSPALAAFSADGARLIVGDVRGAVGLWDGRSGEFAGTLARLDARPEVLAFSADDADALLVGGAHGAVRVPATATGILAAGRPLLGE